MGDEQVRILCAPSYELDVSESLRLENWVLRMGTCGLLYREGLLLQTTCQISKKIEPREGRRTMLVPSHTPVVQPRHTR